MANDPLAVPQQTSIRPRAHTEASYVPHVLGALHKCVGRPTHLHRLQAVSYLARRRELAARRAPERLVNAEQGSTPPHTIAQTAARAVPAKLSGLVVTAAHCLSNTLTKPPVDHMFRRSGFPFLGKLLGLGYPLLDARTSCKLPQYLPHVLGRSSGQLAIRPDSHFIQAILGSDADPADGGPPPHATRGRG